MIVPVARRALGFAQHRARTFLLVRNIRRRFATVEPWDRRRFDFPTFKRRTLTFLESMRADGSHFRYRYSGQSTAPTLYASAYACMTLSLLGELRLMIPSSKNEWAAYFDSFQSAQDGLFYDDVLASSTYRDSDWWGARHLALHMASAYTNLAKRPRHPFRFLEPYFDPGHLRMWLDSVDWDSPRLGDGDVDNKIMNVGCLMQYQRDYWGDRRAAGGVDYLKRYLRGKVNKESGMWGAFRTDHPAERSRMVQFAYHLFPLFVYDREFDFDAETVARHVLNTQNAYGGFGVRVNSSACEDIDSIDLLVRLYARVSPAVRPEIDASLLRALKWVQLNQVEDHGFVFRLGEPFRFGSAQTSSGANAGAMLPTWFRSLSLAYLTRHLEVPQDFCLTNCPGYELI